MAYVPSALDPGGPQIIIDLGTVDVWTARRAFRWGLGIGNIIIPVAPAVNEYSAIATADGRGGILATPGLIVLIETITIGSPAIVAGSLYAINVSGQLTGNAGTAFKALQAVAAGGAGTVIYAEIWRPKG